MKCFFRWTFLSIALLSLSCASFWRDSRPGGRSKVPDFSKESLRIDSISDYVNRLAQKLAAHESQDKLDAQRVHVQILRTSRIQGRSYFETGGIDVTRGMLNVLMNEAELGCLLSHEIGHKVLRHGGKRKKDKSLSDIFLPEEIAQAKWNQRQEQEADEYGALLCRKAGYDPYAFLAFMERMAQFQKSDFFTALDELTATHKDFKNRAKHLRKFLEGAQIESGQGVSKRPEYMSALASLRGIRSGDVVNELLPGGVAKALARLQQIAQELDQYERDKEPLPPARFVEIMGVLADVSGQFGIPGIFTINAPGWRLFMKEVLSQDTPIWDNAELQAKIQDILLQLGRLGVGFIPIAGDAVDLDEFLTGVEFGTGLPLSLNQRVITAAGLLAGSGKAWREMANGIELTLKDARLVSQVGRRAAGDGRYALKNGMGVLNAAKEGKITVIGKHPRYLQMAEKLGARRLKIPDEIWNKMTEAERWSANKKFLNRAIRRGDDIILSDSVKNVGETAGYFRKELDYLIEQGFEFTNDGTRMVRP